MFNEKYRIEMPNMLTDFWAVKLQAILVFFFVLFITFQIWGSE